MMQIINNLKLDSEFSRNILKLMTGTMIAQAIPIAITPILTRLYSPEEFGLLALFISIISIVSVIATMRYEFAIVQPLEDEDALSIVVISASISLITSILLFFLIYFCGEKIEIALGNKEIGIWLYWVPFTMFFVGIYRTLSYWNTRKSKFGEISKSKVLQSVGMSGSQVGLGVTNSGGLIYGYTIGYFIASIALFKYLLKERSISRFGYDRKRLLYNAKKYRKMPLLSTWGALADSSSVQMPILMITKFYEISVVGVFSLTFRVLNLPLMLVAGALSQVLLQKVAQMHHDEPHKINGLIIKIFFTLILMMVPFVGIICFFGEALFAFIFGEVWRKAGEIASVLVFAVAIRFAISPLSSILALERNINLGVTWQFIYLMTVSATLYIFSSYSIEDFIIAFVVHEVILYLLYFAFILKGSKYVVRN